MLKVSQNLTEYKDIPESQAGAASSLGGQENPFEQRRTGPIGCSLEKLALITRGKIVNGDSSIEIGPIATDTRFIEPGDAFLALKGEKFDAHDFLSEAVNKGARLLIVEFIPEDFVIYSIPCLVVEDTLEALLSIAAWYRKKLALKSICITGSCGKTSTKELVSTIFGGSFKVISTYKNFNNLVGLPITLLNAKSFHEWGVFELGMNRPGEIERLTRVVMPDIALITNIGPAHLEGLKEIEGVAKEKARLFQNLRDDSVACVNLDDPFIKKYASSIQCKKIGYTLEGQKSPETKEFVRLVSWRPNGFGTSFVVEVNGVREEFYSLLPGVGNLQNSIAAICVGIAGGIDLKIIKEAIIKAKPMPGRLFITKMGDWTVIDDTYNANPASMKNALATLALWSESEFRCAVLGDMFELGENASHYHFEMGKYAASTGISMILAAGTYAKDILRGASQACMSEEKCLMFDDTDSLFNYIKEQASKLFPRDAWILVKGSRGMRMEKIIDALRR